MIKKFSDGWRKRISSKFLLMLWLRLLFFLSGLIILRCFIGNICGFVLNFFEGIEYNFKYFLRNLFVSSRFFLLFFGVLIIIRKKKEM